jgi:serine/threonine protein kinase
VSADERSHDGEIDQTGDRDQVSITEKTPRAQESAPAPTSTADVRHDVPTLALGKVVDDFEVMKLLGGGGFARVYLARQISLNRLVALKVSANEGSEARTLARLEHQHIVQVFGEIILAEKNLRLLYIQFIPGITLAKLLQLQSRYEPALRSGRSFVEILDESCTEATMFDLGGVEVRAFLQGCSHIELTCWLGARLAEALAHAHSQSVIHLDIKPANILINRYGRPFLADFNVASDAGGKAPLVGGTLGYMSPEQLDAFINGTERSIAAVDARSDVYSLALVLFEFLAGQRPFERRPGVDSSEALWLMSQERHGPPPSTRAVRADVPEVMDRLLQRCLDPQPERRFATAAAMMQALEGCRNLLQVEKEPGQHSWLLHLCRARPFAMLLALCVLPHLIASAINILYNEQLIVDKDPLQKAAFFRLVLTYNSIIYPLLLVMCCIVIWRASRGLKQQRLNALVSTEQSAYWRRQTLALPRWVVVLSCLGWFPGGLIFPLGIHLEAGPLAVGDFAHFFTSFLLSGLIAATYSYIAAQYVVIRALYPQMWSDPSDTRELMSAELRGLPGQLRRYQWIAVLIPLFGAALLIGAAPERLTLGFRVVVTALIVLGLLGFALATRICNGLTRVHSLLTAGR